MTIITLDDLRDTSGALLGKTLGLAISDPTRLIATPLKTIARKKFTLDAAELLKLYGDNQSSALIVGLPVNMNGTHGPRTQSVRDFSTNLLKLQDIPIFLWDERLDRLRS